MSLTLFNNPVLQRPLMFASWPGIGNIGLVATDIFRTQVGAERFGEIDPRDFFYPRKIVIRESILESLEFPSSSFYCKKLPGVDSIAFIGEEQPTDGNRPFAEGRKAYEMANSVVEVALRFGCRRLYASGAAVSLSHHELKPRVWIATTSDALNREMAAHENTILMGRTEGRASGGAITGLNGLVLGVAKARGLEAVCLMGEVPDYLASAPLPYPAASRSVLELMGRILGVQMDFTQIDEMSAQVSQIITGIYEKLPPEIKERVDSRKSVSQRQVEGITEEDGKWMKEHIEDLFKPGRQGDERAG